MSTPEQIVEALRSLDVANHDHWTSDGHPRMDVLQELVGDPSLTRKRVNEASPNFTRSTADGLPDAPGLSPATEQGALAAPVLEDPAPADDDAPAPADEDPAQEDTSEEEDELTTQLADVDARLAEAQKGMSALQREAHELNAARDRLIEERDRQRTPHDDQVERMHFIRSQAELRRARAGERSLVREMELNARGLASSSTLDQSMATRPGHGHGRPPARPLKNTQE